MSKRRDRHLLSKKARNRVFEIVKPWSSRRRLHDLEDFWGSGTGTGKHRDFKQLAFDKKLEFASLISKLETSAVADSAGDDFKEYAGIRLQTEMWQDKSALQVLFGHQFRDAGIVNVDFGENLQAVVEIIEALSGKSRSTHIVFTVGLGGYPFPPSIRLPAHIVRPLEAMRKLKYFAMRRNADLKVELQIFRADHIAVFVNGFDKLDVDRASKLTRCFLNRFLEKFYSDLSGKVIIETDYPLIEGSLAYSSINEASEILSGLPPDQKYIQSIKNMGTRHGQSRGANNSLFYAAAHPFYNGSILVENAATIRPSLGRISEDTILIDFGGRPQHSFNKLGRLLIDAFSEKFVTPKLINILHSSCKTPGYGHLHDKNGELSDVVLGGGAEQFVETKLFGRYFNDMRTIYSHVDEDHYKNFVAEFSS